MKNLMTTMTITALGLTMAWGADQKAQAPAAQGQAAAAQANAPHAYGDKDHDGKCDMTGKPVGQGRQGMGGRGMRGGMGMMANRMGGNGQGAGECCRRGCGRGQQQQAAPEGEKK
jgi:hypothetical protein